MMTRPSGPLSMVPAGGGVLDRGLGVTALFCKADITGTCASPAECERRCLLVFLLVFVPVDCLACIGIVWAFLSSQRDLFALGFAHHFAFYEWVRNRSAQVKPIAAQVEVIKSMCQFRDA